MARQRTHVILPEEPLAQIDALLGEKKRRAFLSEVAAREVRARRLLEILKRDAPVWDPADHPEIEEDGGAAAWVRKLRHEAEKASRRRMRTKE